MNNKITNSIPNTPQIVFNINDLKLNIFSFIYTPNYASKYGIINSFINQKNDISFINKISEKTLNIAIINGHINIIKWLYNNNYNFKFCNLSFNLACNFGYFEIIKYLYSKDKKIDKYDTIYYACVSGHLNIVKFLYSNGFNCTSKAIDFAAFNGHLDIIKYLHKNNIQCSLFALYWAICYNHFNVLQYLHYNKNNIFEKNYYDDFPLNKFNINYCICLAKQKNYQNIYEFLQNF